MPEEVSLKLVVDNKDAIRGVKELNTETQKLYTNTAKQQKEEQGRINELRTTIDKLKTARDKAYSIDKIEAYNKRIKEETEDLKQLESAGTGVINKGQSMMSQMGQWALGFASAGAALKLLTDAFKGTELGLSTFNQIGAVTKRIFEDLASGEKINLANIILTVKATKELNALRQEQRKDLVEIATKQKEFNQLYFESSDRTLTDIDRQNKLNEAIEKHNELIGLKLKDNQKELDATALLLAGNINNTDVITRYNDLLVEQQNIQGEQYSETKRLESQRTALIQEGIDKRLALEKQFTELSIQLVEKYDKAQIESIEGDEKLRLQRNFAINQLNAFRKQLTDVGELTKEQKDMFFFLGQEIQQAYLDGLTEAHPDKIKGATDILRTNLAKTIDTTKMAVDRSTTKQSFDVWNLLGIDISTDKGKEMRDAIVEAANTTMDIIDEVYQKRVEDAKRERELLDTKISEQQSALETEVELAKLGYASNVAAKQKEIEDLKIAREKALKDEEKAIKAQKAADTISQASALVTASAQTLKAFPGPLLPIALVVIGSMFAAFAAAKISANKATKLASGGRGVVNGRLHSEGGEPFLNHVEVEDGEGWGVLSRKATRKYGSSFNRMVDSFNRDSLSVSKGVNINNIMVENEGPNKRLDEVNTNLKRIHAKEEITQIGNRIIITKGSTTRIIKK
jgi:hypothetical protein